MGLVRENNVTFISAQSEKMLRLHEPCQRKFIWTRSEKIMLHLYGHIMVRLHRPCQRNNVTFIWALSEKIMLRLHRPCQGK